MAVREKPVEERVTRDGTILPLRVAPATGQPERRRVTAADRRAKRATTILVLLSLLAIAGVVFGLVLVNIALAQSSFELSDLQKRSVEQESLQRELRYQIARAESPEHVAQAGAELGLVVPDREESIQGPPALVPPPPKPDAGTAGYELSAASP